MKERTLVMVKPDSTRAGHIGEIISFFEREEFKILGIKYLRLTNPTVAEFYKEHKDKPFFQELLQYITSDPVVAIALEHDDAVKKARQIIGATDPQNASPESIRAQYAKSKSINAVHGSDSVKNGDREVHFFFSDYELIRGM